MTKTEMYPGLHQRWGYADVRPGAHTFWWLMESPNKDKPLIMWLQGGPGGSSTGIGNFIEVGPWNPDLMVQWPPATLYLRVTDIR